jgi:hypothetical protein
MRRWILAPLLLVLTSFSGSVQEERYPPGSRCEGVDARGACTIYGVSIVELIAMPRLYDGRRVRVTGWLHLEFEGNGIYLHRDDKIHGLYRNGLWVSFAGRDADMSCAGGYALVEGTFDAGHHGHMGLWSGAIEGIDRCMRWGRREPETRAGE